MGFRADYARTLLLDKGYISAKEATTLLKAEVNQNNFYQPYIHPYIPNTPPFPWGNQPYYTTSTDPIECNKQQING